MNDFSSEGFFSLQDFLLYYHQQSRFKSLSNVKPSPSNTNQTILDYQNYPEIPTFSCHYNEKESYKPFYMFSLKNDVIPSDIPEPSK